MKRFLIAATVLLSGVFNVNAATANDPYQLVESLTQQVFSEITDARSSGNFNNQQMETIIENVLMPNIDVVFASYKILGTQLKKTNKDERKAFVEVMKSDLKKTYSSVLTQYQDQQVNYEPAKNVKNKKTVAIRAELVSDAMEPVDMVFKLRKNKKTGQWKAYDMVVEGISLIDSKRAELAQPIRKKGIVHVTSMLAN